MRYMQMVIRYLLKPLTLIEIAYASICEFAQDNIQSKLHHNHVSLNVFEISRKVAVCVETETAT